MKHDIPVLSRLRLFSSSVQQKEKKVVSYVRQMIHIFRRSIPISSLRDAPSNGSDDVRTRAGAQSNIGRNLFAFGLRHEVLLICSSVPHVKASTKFNPVWTDITTRKKVSTLRALPTSPSEMYRNRRAVLLGIADPKADSERHVLRTLKGYKMLLLQSHSLMCGATSFAQTRALFAPSGFVIFVSSKSNHFHYSFQ
jgi:hypothetical protein